MVCSFPGKMDPMPKQKLNVAMVGQGFMGRVHSNAFCQVGHFFDSPYDLQLKVICGRDRSKLELMAAKWGWQEVETSWQQVISRLDIRLWISPCPTLCTLP